MFICCNKNLLVREGAEVLELKRGFIGNIDDRWREHWYIRAALRDGTISASEPAGEPRPKRKKPEQVE